MTTPRTLSEVVLNVTRQYRLKPYNEFEVRCQFMDQGRARPSLPFENFRAVRELLKNSGLFDIERQEYTVSSYDLGRDNTYRFINKKIWQKKTKTVLDDFEFADMYKKMRLRFSGAIEEEKSSPFGSTLPPPSNTRIIVRDSFTYKTNPDIRFDLSCVKATPASPYTYEFEMECADVGDPTIIIQMCSCIMIMFQSLFEFENNTLGDSFRKKFESEMVTHLGVTAQQYINIPSCSPVTFTRANIDIFYDKVYAITNKLDGERVYLVVTSIGAFCMTSDQKTVRWLGFSNMQYLNGLPPPPNVTSNEIFCIFDCELFVKDDKISINVFDTLWYNGKSVTRESLPKRVKCAVDFVASYPDSSFVKTLVKVKKYWCTSKVPEDLIKCEVFMNMTTRFHSRDNDGTIFVPLFSPYGARNAPTYKFKRVDRMSIDVILEQISPDSTQCSVWSKVKGNPVRYQQFTGSQEFPFSSIITLNQFEFQKYMTKRVGNKLQSGVVELEWRSNQQCFVLTRDRPYKLFPNVINVVIENWNFINQPVTIENLIEHYMLKKDNKKAEIQWVPYPEFSSIEQTEYDTALRTYIRELQTPNLNIPVNPVKQQPPPSYPRHKQPPNNPVFTTPGPVPLRRPPPPPSRPKSPPRVYNTPRVPSPSKTVPQSARRSPSPPRPRVSKYHFKLKELVFIPGLEYKPVDILGGGSCFFHSYLYLTNDEYYNETESSRRLKMCHRERNNFADDVRDNWDKYSKYFVMSVLIETRTRLSKVPNYTMFSSSIDTVSDLVSREENTLNSAMFLTSFITNLQKQSVNVSVINMFEEIWKAKDAEIKKNTEHDIRAVSVWADHLMIMCYCYYVKHNIYIIDTSDKVNYRVVKYRNERYPHTKNIVMRNLMTVENVRTKENTIVKRSSGYHFEPIIGVCGQMIISTFSENDPFIRSIRDHVHENDVN